MHYNNENKMRKREARNHQERQATNASIDKEERTCGAVALRKMQKKEYVSNWRSVSGMKKHLGKHKPLKGLHFPAPEREQKTNVADEQPNEGRREERGD